MKLLLVLLVAIIGSAIAENDETYWTDELIANVVSRSAALKAPEPIPTIIANEGYPVEVHSVVTEDGYILQMHRIPGSQVSPPSGKKPVAFLMHGLLSSSADWIIMGPRQSLGYILADAGYDVWMGNARGTTNSKGHINVPSEKDYWRFSWHEIGIYDLPAMIDYALETTKQKQVFYIGHSQGTTTFYVMASQRPEYNDKIRAMFSLAPVAYMGNLFSPLPRAAALATSSISILLQTVGVHQFLPSSSLITAMGKIFCHDDALSQFLCTNVLFLLCGYNEAQLNATMIPIFLQHAPAGASTRQLVHYGQEIRSDKFRLYDHGIIENTLTYGSFKPPNYNLKLITAPVHLIYSDNDWMAAVQDVKQLFNELGNPAEMYRVVDGKWNHLDFIWGIDAKTLVYEPMINTMKRVYRN